MSVLDRIVCLLKESKKSQKALCDFLGISQQAFTNWKNGHTQSYRKYLPQIADFLDVTVEDLLGKEQKKDPFQDPKIRWNGVSVLAEADMGVVMLPVYGRVAAGSGELAENEIERYEPAPAKYAAGEYFYLIAHGDSMEPRIHDGDLLLIQRTTSVDNGTVAIVLVDGEDGLVKKVIYDQEHISLVSFNPEYKPRIFRGEDVLRLRVLGKVLKAETKF